MDLKGMDQAKDGSFLKLADVRANVEKRIFQNPTTSKLMTTTALDAILQRGVNKGQIYMTKAKIDWKEDF
jgi:hypothetical protein